MKSFGYFLMSDLVNRKSRPQEEVHGKWATNQLITWVLILCYVCVDYSTRRKRQTFHYWQGVRTL